jgi:hypothetical protein
MTRNPMLLATLRTRALALERQLLQVLSLRRRDVYLGYKLRCGTCEIPFGVEGYICGVITCPYCGEHVEG